MEYVAFLRGINVGGNHKLPMPLLKEICESFGCLNAQTFLNTGNVLFTYPSHATVTPIEGSESKFVKDFSLEIEKACDFPVPVLVRSNEQINALCDAIPTTYTNDETTKTDVFFVWDELFYPEAISIFDVNPEIEKLWYRDGAIIWTISRENQNKSKVPKIVGTPNYKKVTVRNINTVRKINGLFAKRAN